MTTPPSETSDNAETTTHADDDSAEPSPLEKGLDFTIGAALLTAETLEQVVGGLVEKGKIAREHAPAVFETLMERGRPTREQWLRTFKGEIVPQFTMGGPGERPAEEEIQTLEERVATLEQQVSPASPNETEADDAIAHEAVVLTGGERADAPVPDAPTQPAISEEITTGTPAEPEVAPPTEQSDAALTGADTATDIEIGESSPKSAHESEDGAA